MDENTINILVGNKQDVVVREVSYEEGLLKGKKRNMIKSMKIKITPNKKKM